ncbi:MAG: iron ABC transporter permease [Peptostreptococcaceae bacterium]
MVATEVIKEKKKPTAFKVSFICSILVGLIFLFSIYSLSVGSTDYGFFDIIDILKGEGSRSAEIIIINLRLPRMILGLIVGASLSVSGALLQSVMRNPLADPGSIGVSAGAGTAAITILLLFPDLSASVPIFAFIGAGLACILIYSMAWNGGINPVRLILSGVAINSVLGAYNSLLQLMNSDNLQGVLSFMNGSLAGRSWDQVKIALVYGSVGLVLGFCCIKLANLLQLGDEMAKSLGTNVSKSRILLSAVSAFLAAATVSVVGMIGFVGLVVPHVSRMIVGSDYKALLPVSTLLGALTLVIADTIGRTIVPGVEIPVGIIMAVSGGPFFLYMLKKGGKVYGN